MPHGCLVLETVLKFQQISAALQGMGQTVKCLEELRRTDLGDFVAAVLIGAYAQAEDRLRASEQLQQDLVDRIVQGQARLPGLGIALATGAARLGEVQHLDWLTRQGVDLRLEQMHDLMPTDHTLAIAMRDRAPLAVFEWFHAREGDAMLRKRVPGSPTVFAGAIALDYQEAVIWMVEKDPTLLEDEVSLGVPGQSYDMELVDYAETAPPSGSQMGGLIRSLKAGYAARQAVADVVGLEAAARRP